MSETILLEDIFKKSGRFVSRRIAEEAVLVPLYQNRGGTDHIFSLNETAASAWVLLDGSRSLRAVVAGIVAEFEVEEADARQDVFGLVKELSALGALEKVS
jgi:hypothetical protein